MYEASIAELGAQYTLNSIYVFGSRGQEIVRCVKTGMRPDSTSRSDVDIAVQPRRETHLSSQERVELMQAFEDLFGVSRVDLVVLPEANSFLARDAIRGELLYCYDLDAQAEEELYYLRKAADLAPVQQQMWRELMEEGSA